MSYATGNDFILAFEEQETIELTNMENSTIQVIDYERLDQALTDASSTIDLYLGRYVLPIVTVSDWLRRCCLDIGRYYLYQASVPDEVIKKYEDWIRRLELIAKGIIKLLDIPELIPTVSVSMSIRVNRGDRNYSDTFRGF